MKKTLTLVVSTNTLQPVVVLDRAEAENYAGGKQQPPRINDIKESSKANTMSETTSSSKIAAKRRLGSIIDKLTRRASDENRTVTVHSASQKQPKKKRNGQKRDNENKKHDRVKKKPAIVNGTTNNAHKPKRKPKPKPKPKPKRSRKLYGKRGHKRRKVTTLDSTADANGSADENVNDAEDTTAEVTTAEAANLDGGNTVQDTAQPSVPNSPGYMVKESTDYEIHKSVSTQNEELSSEIAILREKLSAKRKLRIDLQEKLQNYNALIRQLFLDKPSHDRIISNCTGYLNRHFKFQKDCGYYIFGTVSKPTQEVDALAAKLGKHIDVFFPRLCEYVMGRDYCQEYCIGDEPAFDATCLGDITGYLEYVYPGRTTEHDYERYYRDFQKNQWANDAATPIHILLEEALADYTRGARGNIVEHD